MLLDAGIVAMAIVHRLLFGMLDSLDRYFVIESPGQTIESINLNDNQNSYKWKWKEFMIWIQFRIKIEQQIILNIEIGPFGYNIIQFFKLFHASTISIRNGKKWFMKCATFYPEQNQFNELRVFLQLSWFKKN